MIEQKYLDRCLKAQADFERTHNNSRSSPSLFKKHLPASVDCMEVAQTLKRFGYIYMDFWLEVNDYTILLTQYGLDYLAELQKREAIQQDNHKHDWHVAIGQAVIAALLGAFLSRPFWAIITWIIGWLKLEFGA